MCSVTGECSCGAFDHLRVVRRTAGAHHPATQWGRGPAAEQVKRAPAEYLNTFVV